MDNWKLKKGQLIALINVIEAVTFNNDTQQDKISKIKYWIALKKEM